MLEQELMDIRSSSFSLESAVEAGVCLPLTDRDLIPVLLELDGAWGNPSLFEDISTSERIQ